MGTASTAPTTVGTTWRHLGLEETRHIGKVEVHPTDPDIAYVAALGNLWAPPRNAGLQDDRRRAELGRASSSWTPRPE